MKNQSFSVFGEKFQLDLICCLLNDGLYLRQLQEILDIDFFENDSLRIVVDLIKKHFHKYGQAPSVDSIETTTRVDVEERSRNDILQLLEIIRENKEIDEDFVKDRALDFCKQRRVVKAALQMPDLIEMEDYENVRKVMEDALNAGTYEDLGHDYIEDVDDRLKMELRRAIPTGMKALDEKLKGGGLGPGEIGFVMAFTGVGKTRSLVNFGVEALRNGDDVVHITLELSETYIANVYDGCMFNVPSQEIYAYGSLVKEEVEKISKDNTFGRLKIKQYRPQQATVETLRTYIESLKIDKFKPKLIILDYLDLLKPSVRYGEKRHELRNIAEEVRGLGDEYQASTWTASQTNRGGSNVAIVTVDVMGEAMAKAETADLVVGVGRTAAMKEADELMYFIAKSRLGPDGLAILCKVNPATSRIQTVGEAFYPTEENINTINNTKSTSHKKRLGSMVQNIIDDCETTQGV
jgi:replicative DNA helicase